MNRVPDRAAFVVALASIAILGAAFAFQYIGGLAPCELCILQRWPYVATIVLGLLGVWAGRMRQPAVTRGVLALAGLVFLIGAGIAAYHVGVEQKWWQGPSTCTGISGAGSVQDLLKRIESAPVVRCDEIAWSLFGISMAGYNFLLSIALAAFCALSIRARNGR
jgi:disulfide bond formation protein DsbB